MDLRLHIAFVLFCILSAITSCTTTKPIDICGFYVDQLSERDIEEIKLVILHRTDIMQPIVEIRAERPDRVLIYTGHHENAGDIYDTFRLTKRHGRWIISSRITRDKLTADQIIVTS